MAYQANASEAELVEFLNVAITESGCPGEQWVLIALKVYDDLKSGKQVEADICCNDEATNRLRYYFLYRQSVYDFYDLNQNVEKTLAESAGLNGIAI